MTKIDQDEVAVSLDEPAKMTNWKNEPTLGALQTDYKDARQVTNGKIGQINGWLDEMHVRGAAAPPKIPGKSRAQPKLIRKQAEWRYASLSEPFLSSPNLFDISPVTWEDTQAAKQNQLVLNNQFNTKLDKQAFIDSYVRAGVDEGTIICKVGWDYRTKTVEEQQVTYDIEPSDDPRLVQLYEQIAQLQAESPSQYNEVDEAMRTGFEQSQELGYPVRAFPSGSELVKVEKVVANKPVVEVLDFNNVVIDPSCNGDMSKAKFVVELFESNLATLQADGRYHNLEKLHVDSNAILSEPDYAAGTASEGARNFDFADKARRRLVVHEYWGFFDIDGSGELQPIVAAWVGDVLIRLEANPFPDQQLPYVVVSYLPRKGDLYGDSDGSLLSENQKIAGAVMRGMVDTMAQAANGQTGIAKGALDVTNRRKFDRGENYEFNPGNDPRGAIHTHTFEEIPQSAPFMLNLVQTDAESLTGVKAFSNGISGQALGDTATGVRSALDAASKRELGILRRLAKGVLTIGRKIISMNAEFLDDVEVVRITNEQFVEVRRDDLPGNFDLKLDISTAEEDNAKVNDLSFMLQTMGPNMDWGMNQLILAEIADLKKMPDLAKRIRDYQPQPDPLAQRKAQLELMVLESEIKKNEAQALHYMTGSGLQTAKVGTEQAKSRALGSQADLNDLAFVEQESGVNQERELQKLGAQAENAQRLSLVNARIKQLEENQYPRTSPR